MEGFTFVNSHLVKIHPLLSDYFFLSNILNHIDYTFDVSINKFILWTLQNIAVGKSDLSYAFKNIAVKSDVRYLHYTR